jgi:hypothetical protein
MILVNRIKPDINVVQILPPLTFALVGSVCMFFLWSAGNTIGQ